MIGRRFEVACERLGFNVTSVKTTTEHFRPPRPGAEQLSLFVVFVIPDRCKATSPGIDIPGVIDSGSSHRSVPE